MIFLISLWLKKETYCSAQMNRKSKWHSSPVPILAAALIFLTLLASMTGILRFHPQEEGGTGRQAFILLSNDPPAEQFWSVFEKGKTYHIQGALEWIALLILLSGLYSLLDRRFYNIPG